MKADPQAQQALLQLVDIDTRANQLRHHRANLPELARIKELMAERAKILEDYTAAETQVSDLQRDLRRAEKDLEPVRERRRRDQERLDSGSISDSKALQGIIDEIAHLGRRISELEDTQLEAMEAVDIATKHFDMIAERRATLETEIRGLMGERDAQFTAIDAQLAETVDERAAVVAALPEPLVARYDKIAGLRGTGAAQLVQRRCMGCRLEVDPAELRAIEAAPADEVVTCEECGRILVRG